MHRVISWALLVLLFASTAANLYAQDVSFQPAVDYPAGFGPWSVAVGDFNSDGYPDLAVANAGSNDVSVLLGNGDGTFQRARNFAAGNWPWSLAVGDFNGDGRPDLAVVNYMSHNVSVLLGNGDGTFQEPNTFAVGGSPTSVVVGDFNGDGATDLAVANYANVSVLLGNGNGTFQAPQNFIAGNAPRSVVVGDFNGDGYSDLAVANDFSGGVSVLLGNGDGTFQPSVNYDLGPSAYPSVAVGDFNGDGILDVAVANLTSGFVGRVSVLLGNGDGTFQAAVNFGAGVQPWSVAVGDINGDGCLDLAVANLGDCGDLPCVDSSVSVLLGNGDGTFQTAVNFEAGGGPRSVAVGDFNGDGLLDLAVGHSIPSGLSVLINNTPRSIVHARSGAPLQK